MITNTVRLFLMAFLVGSSFSQDLQLQPTDFVPSKTEFTPVRVEPVVITPGESKFGPPRSAMYNVGDAPPVISTYYWANQGSCIVNTNLSGTVTFFHPGAAGLGFNWCVLAKPLPAPPYTVIYGYHGHLFGKAASLGVHLYDVYTGKFIVYSVPGASDSGAAAIASWKMNNFTTYSGTSYFNYNNAIVTGGVLPQYVRLKDNGTTRTIAVSHDKEVWLTISAVPSTDFITPNFVGLTLRGTGDGMASMMTVYHEAITTP